MLIAFALMALSGQELGGAVPAAIAPIEAGPPAPAIAGGYAPLNPRAAELRAIIMAAVAHITPSRHARAKLLAAERQIVAGTNYRLLLKLRDGSLWRVTVWRRLDGSLQVTDAARTG